MISDFYKTMGLNHCSSMNSTDKRMYSNYVLNNIFKPKIQKCEENGLMVKLSQFDKSYLKEFVTKKVVAKSKEANGYDDDKRIKREMTGASAEYAVLKFFGEESKFDNSIVEKSYTKHYPDLVSLAILCDIKASSLNNVPLVLKSTKSYVCHQGKNKGKLYKCPNLICVTDTESIWLLGIATPSMLEAYSDENLSMISENNNKTGFYGVDKLLDIPKNIDEFKILCNTNAVKI